MKYTMRLNGRLMTDINIAVSLTHEQVYSLRSIARQRELTLKQLIAIIIDAATHIDNALKDEVIEI